ncbi:MAG: hypothetical protein COA88_02165 [Kordia sp.]|nr:MAG: hypothetical protein COA88_02165 [Kordia sp.]
MKKTIYLLTLLFLASCSSDDGATPVVPTFEVTVTQDATTIVVDQIVTITAITNETINEISFSTDGGLTFPSTYHQDFGTTANLYFDFDTLGLKTIVFRVKNNAGEIKDNTVNITVEKGNAVQLQSVQLNSFYDMGNTWDSEYPTTNPNHLADVFFTLLKPALNVLDGTRGGVPTSSWLWYRSATRDNENNLSWNFQNEDLYINIAELTPYITFADDDGGGIVQDIMQGPPFESIIPLSNYVSSQPNTITVEENTINLEYVIGIAW